MATKDKSTAQVWSDIGGIFSDQAKLAELLEKVGPEEYNKFIHSEAYTDLANPAAATSGTGTATPPTDAA